ncbi:hypothetical protein ACFWA9_21760 [Kitasatospora sp. NPDC059973]|uniref:hypothetical protein n=1 Tax=Kitasatospora sp. NPDC059973 TaxID=3347020 RepID=UPI0036CAE01B
MTDRTTDRAASTPSAAQGAGSAAGDDAVRTAGRLRRVAESSEGLVVLDPGISNEEMDGWPAPVPEEIRALLRVVGGVRITVSRSAVNHHLSIEHVDLGHPFNRGCYPAGDSSWYVEHAGGAGTHWFVYLDHGDGHTYVDVDRVTGAWGPVFRFWDATDSVRVAPSLTAWLERLADCLEEALAAARAEAGPGAAIEVRTFGRHFGDRWPDPEREATTVEPVTAAAARVSGDPLLREAAAALPDDALLADLRSVTGPAAVDFPLPVSCRYARWSAGALLSATAWDGE